MIKITNEIYQNIKGLASSQATNEVAQKQVADATAVKAVLDSHFVAVEALEAQAAEQIKALRIGDMMVESTIRPVIE